MDEYTRWKIIFANKFRTQLPLDVEYCSPIALRAIVLDVHTSADILDRIAQTYCDDELLIRDLVRCPNLHETTLAFIALTASDETKNFISHIRVMDVVLGDEKGGVEGEVGTAKKKLNVTQLVGKMSVSQKIKLALSGQKEARSLLIRESS